jgi:hypothetical protein
MKHKDCIICLNFCANLREKSAQICEKQPEGKKNQSVKGHKTAIPLFPDIFFAYVIRKCLLLTLLILTPDEN